MSSSVASSFQRASSATPPTRWVSPPAKASAPPFSSLFFPSPSSTSSSNCFRPGTNRFPQEEEGLILLTSGKGLPEPQRVPDFSRTRASALPLQWEDALRRFQTAPSGPALY